MKETKDSPYPKERHVLHKKIISLMEKPNCYPKKGERPFAILIGGGAASGKTTLRKKIVEKKLSSKSLCATVVDFDEIKEYIPEYNLYKKMNVQQAATLVHKESRDIGALLLSKLIKERKNFIFEGTMARTGKYKSLVNKLREQGYEILLYVVDVPMLISKKRAKERARLTGRRIPQKIIENTHKLAPQTFLAIKNEVDSYHIYDNQNGLILIATNKLIDRQKYADFLKKGSSSI